MDRTIRTCNLYRRLNSEFRNAAFNSGERAMLAQEVTLPDRSEAKNLLPTGYRITTGTEYAISQGFRTKHNIRRLGEFDKPCYCDRTSCCACAIDENGSVQSYQVDFEGKGVRPVITIQL